MYGFFITIHIFICIGLMISVLMQSAKGEGLAGAFGGSSLTGTVFGGRGAAPFLAKATSGLAVGFMLSCILLTFLSPSRRIVDATGETTTESAVQKAAQERAGEMPAQQPGTFPTDQQGTQPGATPGEPPADQAPDQTGDQQSEPPPEEEPGG